MFTATRIELEKHFFFTARKLEHDDVNDDDDGHNEDDNDDDDNDDGDVNEGFINICITLRMQDLTLPLTIS